MPATTLAQLEGRRLDDSGLGRFLTAHGQGAAADWDLSRLTLAAFHFQPELEVARAQLAEAEAGVRTAQARPNPTFTFTPGRSDSTPGGISPWILSYVLNIPIELAGRRSHRRTGAEQRVELARLDLASRAWLARSAVRRALVDLQGAESAAGLWREQLPLLAQAARLVEAQVQAGEVAPLQAVQGRVALQRAELTAREAERAISTARSRLAEAVGVPLIALADVKLSFRGLAEPAEPPAAMESRAWAAQNRADLLAALAAYTAAQSALQVEVARQYPDLTLGPGYQLDQGEGKWSLGLGVTLPVFHQNQGPVAAAEARRAAAAARFLTLQNRVLAEVDRASANYASVLVDLKRVAMLRESLERQTKMVRAQQAAGETSRLDLTRVEIALAEHARVELDARLRVAQALGAMEDAVQRPLAWPESAWRSSPRTSSK